MGLRVISSRWAAVGRRQLSILLPDQGVRVQPEPADTWDPQGPVNGDMWHHLITADVPHRVVATVPFTSPGASRGENPCYTFSRCSEGQFLGSPTPWEADAVDSNPGASSRASVSPSHCHPPRPPHRSQHHAQEQADEPTCLSWRGNNTQSYQSS